MPPQDDELRGIVKRMLDAGESEDNIAAVIKRWEASAQPKADAPAERTPGWLKAIPGAAATIAGSVVKGNVAGPLAAAGAGAVGEGARGLVETLYDPSRQNVENLSRLPLRMVSQGIQQGTAEGAGNLVGGAGKLAARGMYRAASGPVNQSAKYGDLITSGLQERIPVSAAGLQKAVDLVIKRSSAKQAAVNAADDRASFVARGIADDARGPLKEYAEQQTRAAQGNPTQRFDARLKEFTAANPDGTLTPSTLEQVKRTIDDQLGGTYRKLRGREAISPKEKVNLELSQAASRAQESVVPGYRDMNRDIMQAEGLRRMVQRRVSPSSSGGNQGLENALTMLGGVKALPARIAMLPPVMSNAAIGLHVGSKYAPKTTSFALRALMALLDPEGQQDQNE